MRAIDCADRGLKYWVSKAPPGVSVPDHPDQQPPLPTSFPNRSPLTDSEERMALVSTATATPVSVRLHTPSTEDIHHIHTHHTLITPHRYHHRSIIFILPAASIHPTDHHHRRRIRDHRIRRLRQDTLPPWAVDNTTMHPRPNLNCICPSHPSNRPDTPMEVYLSKLGTMMSMIMMTTRMTRAMVEVAAAVVVVVVVVVVLEVAMLLVVEENMWMMVMKKKNEVCVFVCLLQREEGEKQTEI
mmetsp:Transcript_11647/g.16625  ORF Transcript_11647/g.16625 Transcript_11647/m.16625 type:complete len:242 (-) Transcript_11647:368-1093(-)